MIDLVKNVLNNNHLMAILFIVFVLFLSLFAIKNIRKILIGSSLSVLVSVTVALTARLSDTVMAFFRNVASTFGRGDIQSLVSFEKDMAVALTTIEKECNVRILSVFDYISNLFFNLFDIDLSKNNVSEKKKYNDNSYVETIRNYKINMSKFSYSFRV